MNNDQLLLDRFLSLHLEIAIREIEDLQVEDIALLLDSLSTSQSATILARIVPYKAGKVMESLEQDNVIKLIEALPLLTAESILRVADKSFTKHLLTLVPAEKARYLRRGLTFSKDQAGAHLEPYVLTFPENIKIEKALHLVKSSKAAVKPTLYVLNDEKKLIGYVEVKELITSNNDKTIKSIIKKITHTVFANMSVKDLLETWHDSFTDLPVIKTNGEFLGTVSRASLTDVKMGRSAIDSSTIKAGNALGDLYLIGLTSLLGGSEEGEKSK